MSTGSVILCTGCQCTSMQLGEQPHWACCTIGVPGSTRSRSLSHSLGARHLQSAAPTA